MRQLPANNILKTPFNLVAVINHLRIKAQPKSIGWCALYCRNALNAGGLNIQPPKHNRPTGSAWACEYGPNLETVGFKAIDNGSFLTANVELQPCDVAVIQANSKKPYGHMCIFDGKIWISDFRQLDMWGGETMRKEKPSYVIYRWCGSKGIPP